MTRSSDGGAAARSRGPKPAPFDRAFSNLTSLARQLARTADDTPSPLPAPAPKPRPRRKAPAVAGDQPPWDMVPRQLRRDMRLGPTPYLVYAALVSLCWSGERETWASNRKIGLRAQGISHDTVLRAIKRLTKLGYVERIEDPMVSTGRRFRLIWPLPQLPSGEDSDPEPPGDA